jgi:thiamine biosynthesis protein ThiS
MQIKVNGEVREFDAPISVLTLAEKLGLNPRQVAVERNREIVPKSAYGNVALAAGDEIEIVHFIGGG